MPRASVLLVPLLTTLLVGTSCRKEVEKLVVQQVDKQYSWTAVSSPYFTGNGQIILGLSQDAASLYLQQPGRLGRLTPRPNGRQVYVSASLPPLPTDVRLRIPLTPDFFVFANFRQDSVLEVRPTQDPVNQGYTDVIRLRQLDPLAVSFEPNYFDFWRFGAVSRNNYLLLGYNTSLSYNDSYLRFVLAKVTAPPTQPVRVQARTLKIPRPVGIGYGYIRWIAAVDDYFLVNCGQAGLFKVSEAGAVKKVYGATLSDACYQWHGTLYLVEEYNSLLRSLDGGDTWQRYSTPANVFDFTTYHPVGDSLVVATHGIGTTSLFSLRWDNLTYKLRPLKTDGLNGGAISGLAQLGDTVYLSTTSGLYRRPLSKFFESTKP